MKRLAITIALASLALPASAELSKPDVLQPPIFTFGIAPDDIELQGHCINASFRKGENSIATSIPRGRGTPFVLGTFTEGKALRFMVEMKHGREEVNPVLDRDMQGELCILVAGKYPVEIELYLEHKRTAPLTYRTVMVPKTVP